MLNFMEVTEDYFRKEALLQVCNIDRKFNFYSYFHFDHSFTMITIKARASELVSMLQVFMFSYVCLILGKKMFASYKENFLFVVSFFVLTDFVCNVH